MEPPAGQRRRGAALRPLFAPEPVPAGANVLRLVIEPGPVRDRVAQLGRGGAGAPRTRARREAIGGVLDPDTAELVAALRERPDVAALLHAIVHAGAGPVIDLASPSAQSSWRSSRSSRRSARPSTSPRRSSGSKRSSRPMPSRNRSGGLAKSRVERCAADPRDAQPQGPRPRGSPAQSRPTAPPPPRHALTPPSTTPRAPPARSRASRQQPRYVAAARRVTYGFAASVRAMAGLGPRAAHRLHQDGPAFRGKRARAGHVRRDRLGRAS